MKKVLATAFAAMALCAMTVTSAFAAEKISDVYVSIAIDDDEDMYPGDVYYGLEPEGGDDEKYYVDEYDTSSSDPAPRKSYTYTIYLVPQDGYEFTSDTQVHVYGAYDVSISSVKSDELKIKAKAYPYHVLADPENIIIDETEKQVSWDKVDYAKSYNVVIYYTNSNGDERETKKNTSKTYLSLSGYIGKYDDISVSVQAVKGSTDADKYICNSEYVFEDGSVDEDYTDDYVEFNIPTAHTNGATTTGTSNASGSSETYVGPGDDVSDGWAGSGDTWYYYENGEKAKGWVLDGSDWYYMNSDGLMQAGWIYDGSDWYYLNTVHDGTYGRMLAGYQVIEDVTYYFNEVHDGTYGAMYTNRVTPDGRLSGEWGAVN